MGEARLPPPLKKGKVINFPVVKSAAMAVGSVGPMLRKYPGTAHLMSSPVSATPLAGCSAQVVVACSSVNLDSSIAHTSTNMPVVADEAQRIRPQGLNVESQAWDVCKHARGGESFEDVGGVSHLFISKSISERRLGHSFLSSGPEPSRYTFIQHFDISTRRYFTFL